MSRTSGYFLVATRAGSKAQQLMSGTRNYDLSPEKSNINYDPCLKETFSKWKNILLHAEPTNSRLLYGEILTDSEILPAREIWQPAKFWQLAKFWQPAKILTACALQPSSSPLCYKSRRLISTLPDVWLNFPAITQSQNQKMNSRSSRELLSWTQTLT